MVGISTIMGIGLVAGAGYIALAGGGGGGEDSNPMGAGALGGNPFGKLFGFSQGQGNKGKLGSLTSQGGNPFGDITGLLKDFNTPQKIGQAPTTKKSTVTRTFPISQLTPGGGGIASGLGQNFSPMGGRGSSGASRSSKKSSSVSSSGGISSGVNQNFTPIGGGSSSSTKKQSTIKSIPQTVNILTNPTGAISTSVIKKAVRSFRRFFRRRR